MYKYVDIHIYIWRERQRESEKQREMEIQICRYVCSNTDTATKRISQATKPCSSLAGRLSGVTADGFPAAARKGGAPPAGESNTNPRRRHGKVDLSGLL